MNSRLLHTISNAIDNKEEVRKRTETGKAALNELLSCTQNCQNRFGAKSELATEDDLRILQLCDKWEKVLSNGIRTNLSNSTLHNIVNAGWNFTFNINSLGQSLWSYACLHLTKHEQERFMILTNINTSLGYFRAFLRASLNERSFERYLLSWVNHSLLVEYYEEGSLLRSLEDSKLLLALAKGLSSILFALSVDRVELNETQSTNNFSKTEPVIPLSVPVKSTPNLKKKPLRQVISFDKNELVTYPAKDKRKNSQVNNKLDDFTWKSAPPTCLNSPDPNITSYLNVASSTSEPTSSEFRSFRQFFPETSISIESPSQILSRLSERAREIFTSSHSIDANVIANKDDSSDLSASNLKIYESDSEEIAGSINGSVSCLELCFTEDEYTQDEKPFKSILLRKEQECLALQLKCNQIEVTCKERIRKLENYILDLSRENDRLNEQLREYMSAIKLGVSFKRGDVENDEINQYEKKLVQVAQMHAELMEFNQHLQRRLHEAESLSSIEILNVPESNVKVHIPTAFLIEKKTQSYHVYQVFVKLAQEEWNVYHRYAEFRELHSQLKKCHQDIASYKFPPKKTLGKKNAYLVELRRVALQGYLRHIVFVLLELRNCTSRAQLVTLLPFFGTFADSNLPRHISNSS